MPDLPSSSSAPSPRFFPPETTYTTNHTAPPITKPEEDGSHIPDPLEEGEIIEALAGDEEGDTLKHCFSQQYGMVSGGNSTAGSNLEVLLGESAGETIAGGNVMKSSRRFEMEEEIAMPVRKKQRPMGVPPVFYDYSKVGKTDGEEEKGKKVVKTLMEVEMERMMKPLGKTTLNKGRENRGRKARYISKRMEKGKKA